MVDYCGTTIYVDVGYCDPASRSAITREHSHTTELAAANAMEKSKREYYNNALPECRQEGVFYPFVVESTGRLGKSALAFLERLRKLAREKAPQATGPDAYLENDDMQYEGTGSDQERYFRSDISCINARYVGKMAKRMLDGLRYKDQIRGAPDDSDSDL
jgi:hypothetical protein